MMSNCLIIVSFLLFVEASDFFKDNEICIMTDKGEEYVGAVSHSQSGKKCKIWNDMLQIHKNLKKTYFADKDIIAAQNYCRNPNSNNIGPWCFYGEGVNDWEACNIPKCEKVNNCKDTTSGGEYDGFTNVTKYGHTCQAWSRQTPHKHRFSQSSFPEKDLTKTGNACRNPDKENFPWCYTTDPSKRWEYCNITFCDENISQAEYFRGIDNLGSLGTFVLEHEMNELITNMQVVMAIPNKFWSIEVRKKTTIWATKFSSKCQRDLNYFENCKVENITNTEYSVHLIFTCRSPLLSVVIISPLDRYKFTQKWIYGSKYIVNNALAISVYQYTKKVTNDSDVSTVPISIQGNASPFYLLADNVIPYAVTKDDKVVMTISKVGLGRIGFMGGEYFTNSNFHSKLADFFARVYGSVFIKPDYITKDLIKQLVIQWKKKDIFKGFAMWNAHQTLGSENTKLLLSMIKDGLNVVIGIKPWAYYYYVSKFENSEIKELFLAAGLWPSKETVSGDLRIIKTAEVALFPLVHLLEYAKTNKSSAATVSKLITTRISNIPYKIFQDLSAPFMDEINEKISELFHIYNDTIRSLVPCLQKPLVNSENRLLLDLYNTLLIDSLNHQFIAPGVNFYPGTIDKETTKLESVLVKLKLLFNDETYFVGVFVPASERFVAKLNAKLSRKCTLAVNFHLFDVSNWDRWDKWPRTRSEYTIETGQTLTFSSPFGGLLSIRCDTNDDNVNLQISNVLRVAMYDRRNGPVHDSWHQLKKRNVPSSILASDTLVFLVPSVAIRNMEDPQSIMELWDKMIKEEFHLRGRSVSKTYREMVSTDIQIKAGYMHAGYPIGTFIQHVANPRIRDKYLFAAEKMKIDGYWGIIHEVGHNLQSSIFTFDGTVDVTNNIFALVATESMTGKSSWNESNGWVSEGRLSALVYHVNTGDFSNWKSKPFVGLGTYAQLRNDFGWEFYRQIFRRYDKLITEYGNRAGSLSNEEKINLWIVETSVLVRMNLVPLYDYWAWPISDETKKTLNKYPLYLPDDFMTRMTNVKTEEILNKYGGKIAVSRIPLELAVLIGPMRDDTSLEGLKVIEEISLLQT